MTTTRRRLYAGGMEGDFNLDDFDDAPEWLKAAAKSTDNLL